MAPRGLVQAYSCIKLGKLMSSCTSSWPKSMMVEQVMVERSLSNKPCLNMWTFDNSDSSSNSDEKTKIHKRRKVQSQSWT